MILNRANWKVTAEWIGDDINGVVTKGEIDTYEFLTVEKWADDKEKAKKKWQKLNPCYKVINIEFLGIKKIQSY